MRIEDFTAAHAERAAGIALNNYEKERVCSPALPILETVPNLAPFAENNLGVAAFEGDEMQGFLCAVGPFENTFRSTDAVGVFSPMGANGAVGGNREGIYARMYQAAGEKWARAGASSHAVCLYAHDAEAQRQFFRYGFGLRCIDAIRDIKEMDAPPCAGYEFMELAGNGIFRILQLENMLNAHMAACPSFILRRPNTAESFEEDVARCKPFVFAALKEERAVAYIGAEPGGETFIRDTPGYLHIMGAYCMPEHRGKGLSRTLLAMMMKKLKALGYTRLGVDFESINPTAYGFWPKHFDTYTHSVVRRIDEHAVTKLSGKGRQ